MYLTLRAVFLNGELNGTTCGSLSCGGIGLLWSAGSTGTRSSGRAKMPRYTPLAVSPISSRMDNIHSQCFVVLGEGSRGAMADKRTWAAYFSCDKRTFFRD